jgi:hypothetical protein
MRRFFESLRRRFRTLADCFRTRGQLGERIASLEARCAAMAESNARETASLSSKVALLELERDSLLEIVQRDRERVKAEIANYAAARELAAHKTLQGYTG